MASSITGFEYDIFISYRQNDNRSGWVTEFAKALEEELAATVKEPLSIYFDRNPHDGLLETHQVSKSLEGKLVSLIFIPILSQTYCDQKSFAWQHEFCAFNKLATDDQLGRDIKLNSGNVASRILPIKIHDLDDDDLAIVEKELGVIPGSIDFIFKSPGVNRPLLPSDNTIENFNKTSYRNQINKVANAIKEIYFSVHNPNRKKWRSSERGLLVPESKKRKSKLLSILTLFIMLTFGVLWFFKRDKDVLKISSDAEVEKILDRAQRYIDEALRFEDKRYYQHAKEAIEKALAIDSLNERGLYMMALVTEGDDANYFVRKIFKVNPKSRFALLARAGAHMQKGSFSHAMKDLGEVIANDPKNGDALEMAANCKRLSGDLISAVEYARRYERVSGRPLHELLCSVYLELGDFRAARNELILKLGKEELSCNDLESFQRIYLCEGDFEKLEQVTDSICHLTHCEKCPYWTMRARMHVGKFSEASGKVKGALKNYGPIAWRYPAFVLSQIGKTDSAKIIIDTELKFDAERLADTTYHQSIPLYSLSAIHAMRGDYKEATKWLRLYAERGFELGSEWYISHDPLFSGLRANPAYASDFMRIVQQAQVRKLVLREKLRMLENKEAGK